MKKTILFVVLLLSIISCRNQPKVAPASIKKEDTTDLALASTWKGKYPADINILAEKTELNQRIKALLKTPELYGEFAERCAVQSPIEWQDSVLFLTACAPHACTYDEMALCLDKKNDKMWVVILRAGTSTIIADDENLSKPKRLNDYLGDR